MKYYTFHRENNDFEDILKDNNIKKTFDRLGIPEAEKQSLA